MQKKLKLSLILLLLLKLTGVVAQDVILTTGANAIGNGGSVSYSVGQIAYTSEEGSTGSLTQGVQQSYVISTVSDVENKGIFLEVSAFPNPTKNDLVLTINNIELSNLNFQLFDAAGKFLQEQKIINNQTIIDLSYYSSGIYLVKIVKEREELKSFKIIKK